MSITIVDMIAYHQERTTKKNEEGVAIYTADGKQWKRINVSIIVCTHIKQIQNTNS